MVLRILDVEASPLAEVPEGMVFRWTMHHVKELFLENLPPKYVLDGSEAVRITCGPRGSDPHYAQVLGASNVFLEDFDFQGYGQVTGRTRELLAIGSIERALCDVAAIVGTGSGPITEAAGAVKGSDFRMSKEIPRLRCVIPGTRMRVVAVRNLSEQDGELWSARVYDSSRKVAAERPIGDRPNYVEMGRIIRKLVADGYTVLAMDRFDKVLAVADFRDVLEPK